MYETRKNFTMAIDAETGETFHDLGDEPLDTLLKRFGRRSAQPIFVDREGKTFCVGYKISKRWLNFYTVVPLEEEV